MAGYRIGDVVSWSSRFWYVGRVWSSGDLRLEDYHEPVGRAWTEVVVFHEAVALVRTKPVTWLHRPENHSKSTFYSASRGDFGPNPAPYLYRRVNLSFLDNALDGSTDGAIIYS